MRRVKFDHPKNRTFLIGAGINLDNKISKKSFKTQVTRWLSPARYAELAEALKDLKDSDRLKRDDAPLGTFAGNLKKLMIIEYNWCLVAVTNQQNNTVVSVQVVFPIFFQALQRVYLLGGGWASWIAGIPNVKYCTCNDIFFKAQLRKIDMKATGITSTTVPLWSTMSLCLYCSIVMLVVCR
jgi:hypothetical protein